MDLKTISASGYQVAETCLKRYHAEYVLRTPKTEASEAANLGNAVHGALEDYVKAIYVDKVNLAPTLKNLLNFYNKHFEKWFGTADRSNDWYPQGKEQLTTWFKRTNLDNVQVISTEKKSFIPIPTSQGHKRYNYIWDRCDLFEEDGKVIIRVVDYKTWRKNMQPREMRHKTQVRMYAMAAAVQFKHLNPDEIWVQLDQLRYGNPEVKFTREDNVETWRYVKRQAEIIIEADENKLEEKLNPECGYCVIKSRCTKLRKNIEGGGVWSMQTDEELAEALAALDNQAKGAEQAAEEVRAILQARMDNADKDTLDAGNFTVEFSKTARRQTNNRAVSLIVGPDLFKQIGKVSVSDVDALIKSGELGPEKTKQLETVFSKTVSTKAVAKRKAH